MVSDSDGKCYPWYGAKNEVMKVSGPTQLPTAVTVSMHDSFHPQVQFSMLVCSFSQCCHGSLYVLCK